MKKRTAILFASVAFVQVCFLGILYRCVSGPSDDEATVSSGNASIESGDSSATMRSGDRVSGAGNGNMQLPASDSGNGKGAGASITGASGGGQDLSGSVGNVSYPPFIEDPGDLPAKLEARVASGCRSGILVDLTSRRILWSKNAKTGYAIASMSKIMTAYETIRILKEPGSVNTLETVVKVPRKMYRMFSDCHVYMDPRESFTIDELLKCMMIHSANDCAYLLGEHLAGSEAAFVERMNRRAQSMGLTSMSFCNTNGLPDRKRRMANWGSAYDMAVLSEHVLDMPEVMKWAGTRMDSIRGGKFALNNKNKLLGSSRCPGITGLKTGYTDASKFCITVSCERKGHRMICVVMGADLAKSRDRLVVELLNWGYSVVK